MTDTAKKYYLEEMHLFEKNKSQFVFLPTKLLLFQVDEDTYSELVAMKEKYGTETPVEAEDTALLESGIMYEAEKPNNDIIKTNFYECFDAEKKYSENIPITSIVLQIANDCNLNCKYCYGDGGSYGRKRELMRIETAKKAIDLMVSNSNDETELIVIFFGGEPLLNFEVIKAAVKYCKEIESISSKHFHYSMTTNGTILTDEIYNFIKDNRISVMISMDGGKELQDKHRCYEDGSGSFDTIIKNIPKFKDSQGGYLTARATVCRTDFNFKKIKNDLLSLGFSNAVTSIVDVSEQSKLFIGGEYTVKVLEEYNRLAEDYVQCMLDARPFSNALFEHTFKSLYFKTLRIRSCNAGNNGIAIGTDEKIYPCHRFMGMPEYSIGDLVAGIDDDKCEYYRKSNIFTKEGCNDCWARYLCSGGCSHTSACHDGLFHSPDCYCNIYRGLYEIILYTYWKLKEWNEDIFKTQMEKNQTKLSTL